APATALEEDRNTPSLLAGAGPAARLRTVAVTVVGSPVAAWTGPLTAVTVRSGRSLSAMPSCALAGVPATAPLRTVRPSVSVLTPSASVSGSVWIVSVWVTTPGGNVKA